MLFMILKPIGVIHSPYKTKEEAPILWNYQQKKQRGLKKRD